MKKNLLGILAVLMVIALALTGCGQQGEQNAGATGSESRNEAISNENNPAGEVTTEPEVNIGEKPNGSDAMALMAWYYKRDKSYIETVEKDTDGYYHYAVGDKELLCKTNVWDFIETREGKRGTYYVCTYEEYLKRPKAITFAKMQTIHTEMIAEIGTDVDALELYDEL